MRDSSIGFIGGGRIARIILGGWQRAGVLPTGVGVSEPSGAALAKLTALFPTVRSTPDAAALLGQTEWVFLAVHPPVLPDALRSLARHLRPDAVVVSLAPKVPIARLTEGLGGFTRIARTIPNAPSLIGAGHNPVAFGPGLPTSDRERLLGLLRPLGDCPEVPEEYLEAYAVLTAMGPTYLWFQFQEMQALGESFGLSAQDAQTGIARMTLGAVKTFFESGLSAEEVMDLVPVKPLQSEEGPIRSAYQARLGDVYRKLKG